MTRNSNQMIRIHIQPNTLNRFVWKWTWNPNWFDPNRTWLEIFYKVYFAR